MEIKKSGVFIKRDLSRDGKPLEIWNHVQRPTDIAFDREGLVDVSELWWRPGQESFTNGKIKYDLPGGVRVLDLSGNLLLHWCSADREAAGGKALNVGRFRKEIGDTAWVR